MGEKDVKGEQGRVGVRERMNDVRDEQRREGGTEGGTEERSEGGREGGSKETKCIPISLASGTQKFVIVQSSHHSFYPTCASHPIISHDCTL